MSYPLDAQGTIEKFMIDFGETEEQAIKRWESIMHIPLPEIIRPFIKNIKYDYIRELNLDEDRLNQMEGKNDT